MASPDGSVARRFAVLTLLLALAVSVAMTLRKGRIPGTATGPSRRIIGITIISFLAMMFTPTKWTHHFGVFAGLAGSLGALAAVAVTAAAMRSRRNRTIFAATVLFMMALSFASVNGWWYVSNFGVPWSNAVPGVALRLHHHPAGSVRAGPAGGGVAALHRARRQSDRATAALDAESPRRRWPLPSWVLVVFEVVVADARDGRPVPGVVRGPVQSGGAHRQDVRTGQRRDGRSRTPTPAC